MSIAARFFIYSMVASLWSASSVGASLIHVPADQATIQGGIDAASEGDTVVVATGTYSEYAIDFNGKAIRVTGSAPNDQEIVDATVVDGEGRGTVFYFHQGESRQSVLSGLTIQGGRGAGWPDNRAGGVTCRDNTSPTIEHCLIRTNSAGGGGGIYAKESTPRVVDCRIYDNDSEFRGGGIYCHMASMLIEDCIIKGNASAFGGGINCNDCSPTIRNCTVTENYVTYAGGGFLVGVSDPIISNCLIIENNGGQSGGGFSFVQSSPVIQNCTIADNVVSAGGAAAYFSDASPTFVNCILWNPHASEFEVDSGSPTAKFCDIMGGYSGEGNMDTDPLFVDAANDDYHLGEDSPCVDSGTADGSPDTDFEGDARPQGDGIDIGADEVNVEEPCDLEVELSNYPSSVEPNGTLSFTVTVYNSCEQPLTLERAVMTISGPASKELLLYDGSEPITVVKRKRRGTSLLVPPTTPPGTYTIEVSIHRDGEVIDADSFEVDVAGG